jgi:hypothetical protein
VKAETGTTSAYATPSRALLMTVPLSALRPIQPFRAFRWLTKPSIHPQPNGSFRSINWLIDRLTALRDRNYAALAGAPEALFIGVDAASGGSPFREPLLLPKS